MVDLVNTLDAVPLAPPGAPPLQPARAFRFSAEQIADISRDYVAGATMASLAKRYDVKRQSIAALLKREGVPIRPKKVIAPVQVDEAVALYDRGLSAVSIGDQLGFDAGTIWRALKKRGVQMRSPNDWQYEQHH